MQNATTNVAATVQSKPRLTLRRIAAKWLWLPWIFAAAWALTAIADHLWFGSHIPTEFSGANWRGTWTTRYYGGLSGRLLVLLPDPLPTKKVFEAEALVYYPIYSAWKPGQFVRMDFEGRFSAEEPSSSGRNRNQIPRPRYGKLEFKGIAGAQVVDYVAVVDESGSRIAGGYVSQHPRDYGVFTLRNVLENQPVLD